MSFDYETRRNELRCHIQEYLQSQGIVPDSSGMINCISGKHSDKSPSMRIKEPSKDGLVCYSCHANLDIFDAAHLLENKPISGKEFITENINYLSDMFGYAPLEVDLSEQDEIELVSERIHRLALSILNRTSTLKHAEARGWKDSGKLKELGVGTIEDRDSFFEALKQDTGIERQELYDYGLDPRAFGPDKLTFTLFDKAGKPIGFAARDILHEQKKIDNPRNRKYINPPHMSKNEDGILKGNPAYYKNKYVYNLQNAKRAQYVLITEGYADVISCMMNDLYGSAAIGGTALSRGQAQYLQDCGIRDIIISFDMDLGVDGNGKQNRAGQEATIKALNVLREFPSIKTRVLNWNIVKDEILEEHPDIQSVDVDWYVQNYGPSKLNSLAKQSIDPLKYKLEELQEQGKQELEIVREAVKDIAAIEDPLLVKEKATLVADNTGQDLDLLLEEIKRQRRLKDKNILDKIEFLNKRAQWELNKATNIEDKKNIMRRLSAEIESLDPAQKKINVSAELNWVEQAEMMADGKLENAPFLKTGIHFIDEDLCGGVPLDGKLLLFGGKSQVGKTMLQNRMVANILKMNPAMDFKILVWTLDDNKETWLFRLWSALSGLEIYKCQRAWQYVKDPKEKEILNNVRERVKNWIRQGKLVIKDAQSGNDVTVLEKMVREMKENSDTPIIVFFDNFHKTKGANERKTLENTAAMVRDITHKYRTTILANSELRKTFGGDENVRKSVATAEELKETGKLHYDADYIIMLDSPMNRMPEKPDDPDFRGKTYKDVLNTSWQRPGSLEDLPVIWANREKNKIFKLGRDNFRRFYLAFDPLFVKFDKYNPPPNRAVAKRDERALNR